MLKARNLPRELTYRGTDMIDLKTFIQQNEPIENTSARLHCPSCGGRNTFTLTKQNGKLLWNCYKASCKIKGGRDIERTKTDIKKIVVADNYHCNFYHPPEHFVQVHNNSQAMSYLQRNNCIHALEDKLAKIMYDPKQNRVVFLVKDNSQVFDAIGRSMNRKTIPKWYRYGKSSKLFTCGDHDRAILVEDAASACAVSQVATGVALLGTNMKDADISSLKRYDHVYICLDADATRKSLDIHKYLSYFVSCSVIRLTDDLKYFDKEEIKKLVWNNN